MKRTIEIIPLKGIKMDSIDVILGDDLESITNIIGKPDYQEESQLYYDRYEFRLDFDLNKKLEFIELQGPYTNRVIPLIYGVNPFELEAAELVTLLKEKNGSNIDDAEAPYCYCFRNISIGVWRQNIPEDISQSEIRDATDEERKIWIIEQNKAKHFWTIGVGNIGYYDIQIYGNRIICSINTLGHAT